MKINMDGVTALALGILTAASAFLFQPWTTALFAIASGLAGFIAGNRRNHDNKD